ncbi:MAG: thioredoxin [Candidatus Aminicenantes bacterium]|nr:thioredoxin [Candidatus Aminicenantes bacterium]
MAENIVHVTENEFEGVVIKSNIPVLVDFWAVWCGPCHMILPALENIADSYKDKLRVARVNVDENRIISSKYGIMSIPTLLLFKDGEIKETIIGVLPQPKIEEKLKTYL